MGIVFCVVLDEKNALFSFRSPPPIVRAAVFGTGAKKKRHNRTVVCVVWGILTCLVFVGWLSYGRKFLCAMDCSCHSDARKNGGYVCACP